MPRLQRRHLVDDSGLERLRQPRDDVVAEAADGSDRFAARAGPFHRYRRTLDVRPAGPAGPASPADFPGSTGSTGSTGSGGSGGSGGSTGSTGSTGSGRSGGPGRWAVHERIEFQLAGAPWTPLLSPPMRWALRRPRPVGWQPWWAPPTRLDARAADVLGLLAGLALVSAYLGTLLSQTLTFAAGDFGAGPAAQGVLLALARVGVIATLVATAAADRLGRRRVLRFCLVAGCVVMGSVAAAPALAWFGVGQTVARGFVNAVDIVVLVLASEEVPARCRAYAASVLALVGGLGSGMVVWLLPLADTASWGWRLIYLPPFAFLPFVVWAGRRLPESRRFQAAEAARLAAADAAAGQAGPGGPGGGAGQVGRPRFDRHHRRRVALLAGGAFLLLVFAAPASQFQNEFLREERGYSAAQVAAFTLVSGTPAGIGVWLGGRLAEGIGRRKVGATGLIGGTLLVTLSYQSEGWALWAASVVGTVVAALTIPALRVYGPELFPTRLRGRANGFTVMAGMAGSASGVLLAGTLADRWDGLGQPILLLALGPLIVAALVLGVYPETANRSLEEINPIDRPPPEPDARPSRVTTGDGEGSTPPRPGVGTLSP